LDGKNFYKKNIGRKNIALIALKMDQPIPNAAIAAAKNALSSITAR